MGSLRTRLPVAAKTALATAGATGGKPTFYFVFVNGFAVGFRRAKFVIVLGRVDNYFD
jgi:hypothetical protein